MCDGVKLRDTDKDDVADNARVSVFDDDTDCVCDTLARCEIVDESTEVHVRLVDCVCELERDLV